MTAWSDILTSRFDSAVGFVGDALRNPAADSRATLLVLAVLLLVLVILGLTVAIAVSSWRAKRALARTAAMTASQGDAGPAPDPMVATPPAPRVPVDRRAAVRSLFVALSVVVIVLSAAWVAAGVSTAQAAACESCHADSPHVTTAKTDPHRSADCVACHESGGDAARATITLTSRMSHFYHGSTGERVPAYGAPASASCLECHASAIADVTTSEARGLRMSHAEPLAAGAECLDCHVPNNGAVTADTAGMQSCLRCHDDVTASAECSVCHTRDPASSTVAIEESSTAYARRLIPQPDCSGCHSTASCDSCHGIAMPHSQEFKGAGHAREAATELWKDGGKTCQKCHYAGRRECTQCHEMPFLAHGEGFRESHKKTAWGSGCSCHDYRSPMRDRNFCTVCHTTKPANAVEFEAGAAVPQ